MDSKRVLRGCMDGRPLGSIQGAKHGSCLLGELGWHIVGERQRSTMLAPVKEKKELYTIFKFNTIPNGFIVDSHNEHTFVNFYVTKKYKQTLLCPDIMLLSFRSSKTIF